MRYFIWTSTLGANVIPSDTTKELLAAELKDVEKKSALDAQTEDLLADYIKNHLLSRGAPVGSA